MVVRCAGRRAGATIAAPGGFCAEGTAAMSASTTTRTAHDVAASIYGHAEAIQAAFNGLADDLAEIDRVRDAVELDGDFGLVKLVPAFLGTLEAVKDNANDIRSGGWVDTLVENAGDLLDLAMLAMEPPEESDA